MTYCFQNQVGVQTKGTNTRQEVWTKKATKAKKGGLCRTSRTACEKKEKVNKSEVTVENKNERKENLMNTTNRNQEEDAE